MEVLAACHVHSDWSYDGSWSLTDLSAKFSARGYNVLLMTEHDRGFSTERFQRYREACADASSNKMLLIPGIEYSDSSNCVHVLTWGPVPFLGEGVATKEMLDLVATAHGVAVWGHPSRKNAWQYFKTEWAEHLLGIEVWNRKYDGWAPSRTAPALMADANAVPFAGLDFHTDKQMFPLGMLLDLKTELSEYAVLDCLRNRRCQAYAFGVPLSRKVFRKALPVMRVAEHGRRTAARLAHKAGML
jgi:hypothetical protein